jgi:hypothetical protein
MVRLYKNKTYTPLQLGDDFKAKESERLGPKKSLPFNKSLAANTLWRVLTKVGIWHDVIKDKYLPYSLVETWFRLISKSQGSTSLIWKNMIKMNLIIDHWLCWRLGSGLAI